MAKNELLENDLMDVVLRINKAINNTDEWRRTGERNIHKVFMFNGRIYKVSLEVS
jgi:hypothetical protein